MNKRKIVRSSLLFFSAVGLIGCNSFNARTDEQGAHEHTFENVWTYNTMGHWHKANCEHTRELRDFEEHVFGNWSIEKEPTETETGINKRICSVCGYSETETLPTIEVHHHTFSDELTATPNSHYYAATCEHIYETKDSEPHSYGEFTTITEPTQTTTGMKSRVCSVCNYVEETVIPKLPSESETEGEYVVEDYYDGYYYRNWAMKILSGDLPESKPDIVTLKDVLMKMVILAI